MFKIWTGSPFFYPGMNSILLYIGHEVCHGYFPFAWSSRTAGHAELLAMNLWATSLWVFGSYLLFKANIFLAL